jgi:hypothetical protein
MSVFYNVFVLAILFTHSLSSYGLKSDEFDKEKLRAKSKEHDAPLRYSDTLSHGSGTFSFEACDVYHHVASNVTFIASGSTTYNYYFNHPDGHVGYIFTTIIVTIHHSPDNEYNDVPTCNEEQVGDTVLVSTETNEHGCSWNIYNVFVEEPDPCENCSGYADDNCEECSEDPCIDCSGYADDNCEECSENPCTDCPSYASNNYCECDPDPDFCTCYPDHEDCEDLPVTLIDFRAECLENNMNLFWSTASELNASHYDVLMCRDGSIWEKLATIEAAGTTNQTTNYNYTGALHGRLTYYKLNQVDLDGANEEFGPISLLCDNISYSLTVQPNPSSENFNVHLQSSENIENVEVQLVDMSGRVIMSQATNINSGSTMLNFETENIQAGTYMVRVLGQNDKFSPLRVVKM